MKGAASNKVIMGATLVMVISLAVVLGLVMVLLAELYCTFLLRRRQLQSNSSDNTTTTTTITTTIPSPTTNTPSQPPQPQNHSPPPPPLASYYAHGVLQAPRKLLFPAISFEETKVAETKNQHSQLHHILQVHPEQSNTGLQQVDIVSTSPQNVSFATSPLPEIPIETSGSNVCNDKACRTSSGEQFVYISNPIYDNETSRPSMVDTPFETPDSSPSRLESGNSSDDEEIAQPSPSSPKTLPVSVTPPLTPIKKLPAEACSVSLRDARSLGTSGSDSVSNNGLSSSSSGTPCTSPSW